MRKITLLFLFYVILFIPSHLSAVKVHFDGFRLNRYVFYQVFHKVQGIAMSEFKNITIIEDTAHKLIFEYAGKRYEALIIGQGVIFVDMPEGMNDRYLSQDKFPSIIF